MTVYYVNWWNPKTWTASKKAGAQSEQPKEARNAPLPSSTGAGNPRGTNLNTTIVFPGTNRNYTARAGKLYNSSIVAAALGWMGSNAPQAPLVAFRTIEGADKPRRTPGHAIDALLAKPNRYYSYAVLIASTLLSLVVNGNAYWYIVRGEDGAPKELWWIDHTRIEPSWESNATTDNWVSHYTYRTPAGQWATLPFEDVIHFREGALDPDNSRKSLSRLATALRRIALMHDIENYEAALLSNMGVAGLIFMPKENGGVVDDSDLEEIRDTLDDRISGDNRGMSVGLKGAMDVIEIGKSPEEMLLDTASDAPEATICALIGISPITLNLKVGLKEATYDNKRIANLESWQNGIVPRLLLIASECTVQLVPLYPDAPQGLEVLPDLSRVAALQPDKVTLYKALREAVGGPFMMIDEARGEAGKEQLAPDDLATLEALRSKSSPATPTPDPTGDNNA